MRPSLGVGSGGKAMACDRLHPGQGVTLTQGRWVCAGVVALFPPIRDMLGGIPVGTEAIRIAVGFG